MSAEVKKEIELEWAHVLFIDIVGYSKLLISEQRAFLETLNQIVRSTEQFRKAEAAGTIAKAPGGRWHGVSLLHKPGSASRMRAGDRARRYRTHGFGIAHGRAHRP